MGFDRREVLVAAGSAALAGCSTTVGRLEDLVSMGNRGAPRRIDADPDAGFHYPYFLVEPGAETDEPLPLFVQTHNAPAVSDRAALDTQVRHRVDRYLQTAHELGLPGVVPAFPRTPRDGGDLVQNLSLPSLGRPERIRELATDEFPANTLERVDRQLIRMLADARRRLMADGYDVTDGVHMLGFSSSGQFASRFAFLHPGRVRAISVGGDGAHPLPRETINGIPLPYPLGTADYRSVTGRPFDIDAWGHILKFVFVGEADQPLPDTDPRSYYDISTRHTNRAVAVFGENRVTERLPVTHSIYTEADANAAFRVYADVGHSFTPAMREDVQACHLNALDAAPGEPVTTVTENVPPKPPDLPSTVFADRRKTADWWLDFAEPPESGQTHVDVAVAFPGEDAGGDIGVWVFDGRGVDMGAQLRQAPALLRDNWTVEHIELDPDHRAVPLTEGELVTGALMGDPEDGPLATATVPVN
jgi:hypothetical protein